jgi:hypothetical protein
MMSKAKLIIGFLMLSFGLSAFASDPIPDPTVQITTPPAGLPGANTGLSVPSIAPVPYNEFNIQGIFIAENKNVGNNKVFMNNGFYKVGDIVSDQWRVKSITRKLVVLVNLETKKSKNLNISGE